MFLILDITNDTHWPKACPPGHPDGVANTKRIPDFRRPTVLQLGSPEEARVEVERLLRTSPNSTYALFECVGTAVTEARPWAVTGAGAVVEEVRVPRWVSP